MVKMKGPCTCKQLKATCPACWDALMAQRDDTMTPADQRLAWEIEDARREYESEKAGEEAMYRALYCKGWNEPSDPRDEGGLYPSWCGYYPSVSGAH